MLIATLISGLCTMDLRFHWLMLFGSNFAFLSYMQFLQHVLVYISGLHCTLTIDNKLGLSLPPSRFLLSSIYVCTCLCTCGARLPLDRGRPQFQHCNCTLHY